MNFNFVQISVWGDHVRRPHHRRLGQKTVQDLLGGVHGPRTGTHKTQSMIGQCNTQYFSLIWPIWFFDESINVFQTLL